MSFYPQPNNWTCGPFALKYAMVMLGKFENETEISLKAGANWWNGVDEIGLAKAAKCFGCELKSIRRIDETKASSALLFYLAKGFPCILCVDEWSHWITIINSDQNKFIGVDSEQSPVIQIYSWEQLKKRWVFFNKEKKRNQFDFYPVLTKKRKFVKPVFTLNMAQELRKEKNYDLAQKWDEYFSDLIAITNFNSSRNFKSITITEFLNRYSKMIIDQVSYWHGFPTKNELKDLLKRFEFVAITYNIVVAEEKINEAISAFSSILSLYSCGKYGMNKIYL